MMEKTGCKGVKLSSIDDVFLEGDKGINSFHTLYNEKKVCTQTPLHFLSRSSD